MKLLSKIIKEKYLKNSHTTNNKAQEDFIIEIYREEDKGEDEVKKSFQTDIKIILSENIFKVLKF